MRMIILALGVFSGKGEENPIYRDQLKNAVTKIME